MNQSKVIPTAITVLLLAVLVGINAFPFWIRTTTSYETVFFALSAIHAELCLFVAWCIFVQDRGRYGRWLWSLLGITAAEIAAVRLLAGGPSSLQPWPSVQLGICAIVPAIVPMTAIFMTQKYCAGTEFVRESKADRKLPIFRLSQLFILIGVCALLSLSLRHLIQSKGGWIARPFSKTEIAMTCEQSFAIGLLAAPCALTILRPNPFCVVWLVYFIWIAAVLPLVDKVILELIKIKSIASVPGTWFEFYPDIVIENITWYGPQLLPTVVLFVLLRLAGIRVQDTK